MWRALDSNPIWAVNSPSLKFQFVHPVSSCGTMWCPEPTLGGPKFSRRWGHRQSCAHLHPQDDWTRWSQGLSEFFWVVHNSCKMTPATVGLHPNTLLDWRNPAGCGHPPRSRAIFWLWEGYKGRTWALKGSADKWERSNLTLGYTLAW